MKNILMILLAVLFFGTTSHAARYYCSLAGIQFNDSQGNALFKGVLTYYRANGLRYFEVNSYSEYESLYNQYCSNSNSNNLNSSRCSFSFNRNLNAILPVLYSNISYTDCLDRLLRPAEEVSRVCDKEFFTAANFSSARRAPKIGQIKVHFGRTSGSLRTNPQVLQAPIDCQYF